MLKHYRQLLFRHTPLHYLGPLLNEFLVDVYSAVEDQKLLFVKYNQKKVCPCRDLSNDNPGRVFLPASFTV